MVQWEKARPEDIKPGTVWYNRWSGTTKRTILEVSMDLRPASSLTNRYERKFPGCKYLHEDDPVPRVTSVRWFTNWAADKTRPRIRESVKKIGRPPGNARREIKSIREYKAKNPHLFVKSKDRSWIDLLPDI